MSRRYPINPYNGVQVKRINPYNGYGCVTGGRTVCFHHCLLSLFCRKNKQIMTSKIASVNHHFITYSSKVSAIGNRLADGLGLYDS